jgi:hypothetical protein
MKLWLFVCVCGTGLGIQDLTFARQAFYHLNHSTSPFFVLANFEIESHKLFALVGLKAQSS